jgi:hypothetical protein
VARRATKMTRQYLSMENSRASTYRNLWLRMVRPKAGRRTSVFWTSVPTPINQAWDDMRLRLTDGTHVNWDAMARHATECSVRWKDA